MKWSPRNRLNRWGKDSGPVENTMKKTETSALSGPIIPNKNWFCQEKIVRRIACFGKTWKIRWGKNKSQLQGTHQHQAPYSLAKTNRHWLWLSLKSLSLISKLNRNQQSNLLDTKFLLSKFQKRQAKAIQNHRWCKQRKSSSTCLLCANLKVDCCSKREAKRSLAVSMNNLRACKEVWMT